MLKAEELTKEQLVTVYNRLRTESETKVTNLHAKLEAQTKNALVSNLDDIIERKDQLHSLTGCTPEGMSSRLPESYAQITLTVAISYA